MLLALPILAAVFLAPAAQAQSLICEGRLTVVEVRYGTESVTRDPNDPASREQLTLSVTIENVSNRRATLALRYVSPSVRQDFLSGQFPTLEPLRRVTLVVANVMRPGEPDATVRRNLQIRCL